MKSLFHAKISAARFGGNANDYQRVHDFMDSSKAHFPDIRHRAILHSSFGIHLADKVFGTFIVNSDGKEIPVKSIAEQHILDDLGQIPTVQDYLEEMPVQAWMGGTAKKREPPTILISRKEIKILEDRAEAST